MNTSIDLYDHNKHQNLYISDYIKFADGKAGFTFGVATLLFGYFIIEWKHIWEKKGITDPIVLNNWLFYGYLIGLVLLAIGIVFLILTVWPRYVIDRTFYHSWGGISAFDENRPADYQAAVRRKIQSPSTFLDDMMTQNHTLAWVCRKKYTSLRRGYFFLAVSFAVTGITWILG